jgi:UDP-N-acetylmuramyl tripeptide synthase
MEGSAATVRVPGGEIEVELPLPGLYNLYNALAAISAALVLGVAPERIAAALGGMRAAFGRVETIPIGDKRVSILLIKNPAGANEVLRTLKLEAERPSPPARSHSAVNSPGNCERQAGGAADGPGIDLWVALNDRIADGRDVSWIWDADFELLADKVRRVTCAGTRAPEMALRLKYAGWPEDRIAVEPGVAAALDAAVAAAEDRLFALPTYTALLELRKLLADRGLAKEFWR